MSSAPYWGKLPAPSYAAPNGRDALRRMSADAYVAASPTTTGGQIQYDYPKSPTDQPRRRSNRISVQTTNSDAPTEDSFSPFVSPTNSFFAPKGLAPRPPSYPYGGASQPHPPDVTADSRAIPRQPHAAVLPDEAENDNDYDAIDADHQGVPPPAAPDVPKGPPVSYRNSPFGNGGYLPPYPPQVARPPRRSGPPLEVSMALPGNTNPQMDAPTDSPMSPQGLPRRFPMADRRPRTMDANATPRTRLDMPIHHVRKGTVREIHVDGPPPQRSASKASQSDRQRAFADERSPLQRLEQTLDVFTKEEKRARVEAAERRAKEQQLQSGLKPASAREQPPPPRAPRQQPPQSQASFRDRNPPAALASSPPSSAIPPTSQPANEGPAPRPRAPPGMPGHAPGHRRTASSTNRTRAGPPLSHNPPPEEIRRRVSNSRRSGHAVAPTSAQAAPPAPVIAPAPAPGPPLSVQLEPSSPPQNPSSLTPAVMNTDIPQRNRSFRERAAQNDMMPPGSGEPSPTLPTPPAKMSSGSKFSLTRSGSNKLRKDPPGDRWYRLRLEAGNSQREEDQSNPSLAPENMPDMKASLTGLGPAQGSPHVASIGMQQSQRHGGRKASLGSTAAEGPEPPVQFAMRRSVTEPLHYTTPHAAGTEQDRTAFDPTASTPAIGSGGTQSALHQAPNAGDSVVDSEHERNVSMMMNPQEPLRPGNGIYEPPVFLTEWKKATVGNLGGGLLDLHDVAPTPIEKDKTWWESNPRRRSSLSSRTRNAEAFDGDYDEVNGPTRFKPNLYIKCGPLLRYCGLRREKSVSRGTKNGAVADGEFWRGTVMIVTRDEDSSYEIAPTLRLFAQPIEPLPPPPAEIRDELPPEYVDPIAGHPKLGRRGETLYVRPVEHLEEAKDLSRDETDDGLFEKSKSPPDDPLPDGATDLPGSFTSRLRRAAVDGEKVAKYKDIRGFRLHAERGCTFWRFNIEVELREKQQRIAYRINRGPATGFWVPARGQSMNVMFYSCNGFSLDVNTDDLCGPDPMWRDVLNTHQSRPFHTMVGGGDQIYNDLCMRECKLFAAWSRARNPLHKHRAAFTPELQDELETFYLERYCMWFSQGLFALANSQIPMVNMFDDHDIIDGYGSYPHHEMSSPVFSGLGAVAFKYYLLFQHQSTPDETETAEPSWILGVQPGPYIHERSRSVFVDLGSSMALLAVDCRTERTELDVISEVSWEKIMDRCFKDIKTSATKHLLVLLGVPIAYPRLVWLENIITSRLMQPVKALGRTGMFNKALNNIDGGVEVLDDLNDHWTAKNHKTERKEVIEQLQDLAMIKSVRVTILSGDVHLAAVGQFYSHERFALPKHKDFRYMPNVISSAIANTPPGNLLADVLNKRNKVHHFDRDTEESMIPLFETGVEGKARNNKCLLPHRNWCSIREWTPGSTPPPTPPLSPRDRSPSPPPPQRTGSIFRRFSLSRSQSHREPPPSGQELRQPIEPRQPREPSRPPISGSGSGLFRSFSRRSVVTDDDVRPPKKLTRSLSLTRSGGGSKLGRFFRRGKGQAYDENDADRQWYTEGGDSGEPSPHYDEAVAGPYGEHGEPTIPLNHRLTAASQQPPRRNLVYHESDHDAYELSHSRSQAKATKGVGDISMDYDEPPPVASAREAIRAPSGRGAVIHYDAPPVQRFRGKDVQVLSDSPELTRNFQQSHMKGSKANRVLGDGPFVEYDQPPPGTRGVARLRGGAASEEYSVGDEAHFTARPPPRPELPGAAGGVDDDFIAPKPFHRTPTGLTLKKMKDSTMYEVNLEGGLDICLNVEVNPKDPAGITMPYRLLVPQLFYDAEQDDMVEEEEKPVSGIKRFLSSRKKVRQQQQEPQPQPQQQQQQQQQLMMTPAMRSIPGDSLETTHYGGRDLEEDDDSFEETRHRGGKYY